MDQLPIYSQALDSVHVNRNGRGGSAIYLPVMQMHGTPYNQGPRVAAMIERSIDVDVRCSAADVYHTHRYTLAAGRRTDIYFLFNQSNERREVEVTFRCAGEPELWDPATGSTRALLRWRPASRGTTVRLDMERYAGLIVVFDAEDGAACSPGSSLRVSDDNLDELVRVDGGGTEVVVEGLADSGGRKHVTVDGGADPTRFRGAREVEAPPAPLTVGGDLAADPDPDAGQPLGGLPLAGHRQVHRARGAPVPGIAKNRMRPGRILAGTPRHAMTATGRITSTRRAPSRTAWDRFDPARNRRRSRRVRSGLTRITASMDAPIVGSRSASRSATATGTPRPAIPIAAVSRASRRSTSSSLRAWRMGTPLAADTCATCWPGSSRPPRASGICSSAASTARPSASGSTAWLSTRFRPIPASAAGRP